MPQIYRRALAASVALLAPSCSALKTFDALVPKDSDGVRVATAVPYGDGPRRKLDIYAPRRSSDGAPRPIIIFFYGGSWASGTRAGYAFAGRALAAQGFVTVIPDYRLVPEVRYPGFVEDSAAAVRWVAQHGRDYGGDPDSIVLVGHSAGAYIAAMLALDSRWLGPDRRAVKGFAGLAGPYDFAPFDVAASRAAFGNWSRPAETQPISWASAGDPPTLLLVGDRDRTVMPRNSVALARKLADAGVAVKTLHYPQLGHVGMILSFARPFRGRSTVLADVISFAKQVTSANMPAPEERAKTLSVVSQPSRYRR